MQSHRRRAALRRCVQACVLLGIFCAAAGRAGAAPCPDPTEISDPDFGQINWSTSEAGCTGFGCDGHTPDTGTDGTVFDFRIKYTDHSANSQPQTMYLLIDTNGDGIYPCTPADAGGSIGSLEDLTRPAPPTTPRGVALLGTLLAACAALAVRRSHPHWLRVSGAAALALFAALACGGGGGGGGGAPAGTPCAEFEAYTLTFLSTVGSVPNGFDLDREIKLCGKSRSVAFLFYVTTVAGKVAGGPAEGEHSMNTQ
jgi:hypothetical protein